MKDWLLYPALGSAITLVVHLYNPGTTSVAAIVSSCFVTLVVGEQA